MVKLLKSRKRSQALWSGASAYNRAHSVQFKPPPPPPAAPVPPPPPLLQPREHEPHQPHDEVQLRRGREGLPVVAHRRLRLAVEPDRARDERGAEPAQEQARDLWAREKVAGPRRRRETARSRGAGDGRGSSDARGRRGSSLEGVVATTPRPRRGYSVEHTWQRRGRDADIQRSTRDADNQWSTRGAAAARHGTRTTAQRESRAANARRAGARRGPRGTLVSSPRRRA